LPTCGIRFGGKIIMNPFHPKFTITNRMTAAIAQIERARGFLEAAKLSDE
jgi:hypothetical protein